MRLLNIVVPMLSTASSCLVAAAPTEPVPDMAELTPPKNIVVAKYHGNDQFEGPGAVLYGIYRCINFAYWEVIASVNINAKVNCTFYTDVGCQRDKAWHYVLHVEGPKDLVLPEEFLGLNRNRTEVTSYECGIDHAVG